MPTDHDTRYQFGEFTIDPNEGVLLHADRPVPVTPHDFSILTHLVTNPAKSITADELNAAAIGKGEKRHHRNLSFHISRIRKALGDDALSPKFVRTVRGRNSYRFIAPVETVHASRKELPEADVEGSGMFRIATHLFVPVFLGEDLYEKLRISPVINDYGEWKVFETEKGALHIPPNGFAVWVALIETNPDPLRGFAEWRREIYEEILTGRHPLNIHIREMLRVHPPKGDIGGAPGRPGYVFSLNVLRSTKFRNPRSIRNVLQILACPSALHDGSPAVEKDLLKEGVPGRDVREFGMGDVGFASWDSLSYLDRDDRTLEPQIIELEVALQSTWWMAKCTVDALLSAESRAREGARNLVPEIRRRFAKLKYIGANESPSRRTMVEAVIKTSRIADVVDEAIDLSRPSSE